MFLDSITEKKLNYPNRTFTYDGASMPIKKNRFENDYKKFLLKKIKLLWLNARISAKSFYQNLGYETMGKTFNVQGIGVHQFMYKKLLE